MDNLAILGGEPTKKTEWPAWPEFDENERKALMNVLKSRIWWRTPGKWTLNFETDFARYHQAKHGVAVTNGTAALEVSLVALGIGAGDEVIIPDFTFVATASAVLSCGAMPIMVDVTPDTYCIDHELIEAAITPKTKAVIAVHMGGHPADLDAIRELCIRRGLYLIEDSSHAHGTEWKGHKIGAIGDIGTFSFQSSKLMTAGEGGMILTNSDELERKVRSIHDCGRMPGEWFYSHFTYGSNYRLSEWQGAVLCQQLKRLDVQAAVRTRNSAILDQTLPTIEGITPQRQDPRCTRNGHYAYIFHYDKRAFADLPLPKFIECLNMEGIPTQASYPPIHTLDLFRNGSFRSRLSGEQMCFDYSFLKMDYKNSFKAAFETVWLPNPVLLASENDIELVVKAIQKIHYYAEELVKTQVFP
jgi:dTDP-4-amino-4,6-dideoxygalactose transaminase